MKSNSPCPEMMASTVLSGGAGTAKQRQSMHLHGEAGRSQTQSSYAYDGGCSSSANVVAGPRPWLVSSSPSVAPCSSQSLPALLGRDAQWAPHTPRSFRAQRSVSKQTRETSHNIVIHSRFPMWRTHADTRWSWQDPSRGPPAGGLVPVLLARQPPAAAAGQDSQLRRAMMGSQRCCEAEDSATRALRPDAPSAARPADSGPKTQEQGRITLISQAPPQSFSAAWPLRQAWRPALAESGKLGQDPHRDPCTQGPSLIPIQGPAHTASPGPGPPLGRTPTGSRESR
ncbi:hypothetical protein NDU88_000421 [Pleurodeles waltl]|uniref:Uncharacterized protein n=1 Tax=Pleurodeles waltl TaxID=8319 RepID=A0AAV7S6Y1_PLEWA|nr:hypothetical protein NDU88_000421 [Pleurodeles waltl]